MLFNSIYWLSVALVTLAAVFCGFVIGINDQKKKTNKHYVDMVNRAMVDAYNAGYADGSSKGKKRPSGNGGE